MTYDPLRGAFIPVLEQNVICVTSVECLYPSFSRTGLDLMLMSAGVASNLRGSYLTRSASRMLPLTVPPVLTHLEGHGMPRTNS